MADVQQSREDLRSFSRRIVGEDGVVLWSTRADAGDQRVPWAWLGTLTLAALVLRVIGLDGGFWFDEIRTLFEGVRPPLYEIVTKFPSSNQHMLFSILAHVSASVFGESPWSVRLPSLAFGVATVPVLYVCAREFVTRQEALLACLLLTTAYHHVWFSQNARGYAALAFLTLLSSWLLMRGLRRGRSIDAVWYGLAAALGVYAHLTMVFLVVSHALLCAAAAVLGDREDLIARRGRFAVMAFVLAAAFTLLIYSPVLLDVRQFFANRSDKGSPALNAWAFQELIRGLRVGLAGGVGLFVGAVFSVVGLLSYLRQSPFVAGMFVLPGVVTAGAILAIGHAMVPRFLFFVIGFALLIVVRGVLEIGTWLGRGRTRLGHVLVIAMAVSFVISLAPIYRYPKQDFEGALRFVEERRAANERIVTVGVIRRVYRDYYRRPFEEVRSADEFAKIRADGQPVWVLYTMFTNLQKRRPDFARVLRSQCAPMRVFRGTLSGGDVTVCLAQPTAGPVP